MENLLDKFVYSQPLPAIIALLIIPGFYWVGERLALFYYGEHFRLVEKLSGFVFVVIVVGFLSDLFLHGVLDPIFLNIIATLFVFLGLLQLYKSVRLYKKMEVLFNNISSIQRYQFILALLILFFLLLSALAPPTDADSLDYHLGVPLVWLDHGGYQPLDSWYHARLAGLGERIILFGLINGSDVLSALLQWSGLLIAIVSVYEFSKSKSFGDLILSVFLVLSPPVIVFMVLNQKPYLFPAASIILGVALILSDRSCVDYKKRLPVGLLFIMSAALYKYSFLLSIFGVGVLLVIHSYREHYFKRLLVSGVVLVIIIFSPYYLRNFIFFNDPFSPLLSKYIDGVDPALVAFMDYLRIGYYPSLDNILKIPFDQGIIPTSLGRISTVIGLGGVGILIAFFSKRKDIHLVMLAFFVMFSMVVLLGRPISRFMFDVYLVGSIGLIMTEFDRLKCILSRILSIQAVIVLLMLIFSLYALVPGIFSDDLRMQVMIKRADGYEAGKLLDKELPDNAVLLTDIRSKVLIPRKVIFADDYQYAQSRMDVDRLIIGHVRNSKISHVVIDYPVSDRYESLLECANRESMEVYNINKATRNPLNQAAKKMVVFELIREKKGCFLGEVDT